METYLSNIWLISDECEFESFTFTGGKVILIAEEPDQVLRSHPAIITAGILLPPIEGIQAELDGYIDNATLIYEQYLESSEVNVYINIILTAAIQQVPIGVMFGRDELNMQFPKMFINYLYKYYGLVIGIKDSVASYIEALHMPGNLAKLYLLNMIDYTTFIQMHPALPIHPSAISKLAYEQNPIVPNKTVDDYINYFNNFISQVQKNGGKMLIDPLEAL